MSSAPSADPGRELARHLRLACEAHEPDIAGHLERVTHYTCEIARALGLPEAQVEILRLATPLHDLGKIGVPLALLDHKGRLTSAEMDVVRTHAAIGHRILDGSPWPAIQCAAQVAFCHHEHWDGSGYPRGLRGEAIPLEARIVAVADVYDALLSQRSYKSAWDADRALAELQEQRGRRFDPAILDRFVECLPAITASAPANV